MTGADSEVPRGLRFCVLGPLQVSRDDRPISIGGAQQRAVLAFLLTERDRAISVEEIADALWREHPPAGHSATIQSYVFRLREVLEPERHGGEPPHVLTTEPGGYRLHVGPGALDVTEFEHLLESGARLVARGQPAEGAVALSRALSLWRGPVLADLARYDFVARLGRRLEEQRLEAVESRIDAELALGRHASLIGELNFLAESYPLREHVQAQRILALYRSGRQADALDAYREVRSRMVDELGIEPGAELTALHHSILDQDPGLLTEPAAPGPRRAMPPQRRVRRSLVAVAAIAAVVLVGAGMYVVRTSRSPSLDALPANSVVRIDDDGSFHDAVAVGVSPDGVVMSGHAAWVANTGTDTVSKIDLQKHLVVQTTPVRSAPQGLAVSGSDLWVVNGGDSSVSRLSLKTDEVVHTIGVGNQPGAIAVGDSGVWVVNTGDGTVQRIDPDSGETDDPMVVGLRPDGIAVDEHTVWVANGGDGTVSPIDAQSRIVGSSIAVGAGPAGIVATESAVWVANSLNKSVTRIDPASLRVVATIPVGEGPQSITMVRGRPWVSNELDGTVTVIDPQTNQAVRSISTGSSVRGLVSDGASAYASTRSLVGTGHTGGTLRITTDFMPNDPDTDVDPSNADVSFRFPAYSLVYDGLVGLQRTGGAPGLTPVPDLAKDLPVPSADGREYVFTLRRGIHYSSGGEVRPEDIRRGVQQELTVSGDPGRLANIVGAPACIRVKKACDLSRGVVVDDETNRIAIHLRHPDPDFVYKLTEPVFATPVGEPGVAARTPRPATGPYMISEHSKNRFTLVRNPRFHPWSSAAQPPGYPETIEWRLTTDADRAVRDVRAGAADLDQRASEARDYAALRREDPDRFPSRFTAVKSFLFLNSHIAPFDNPDVRKAINFAIDRDKVVELAGGTSSATPSCQILAPNLPAHRPYCPYTPNPGAGSYHGPDVARASALVARSGTRGMSVTVVSAFEEARFAAISRYVARVLTRLGYRATFAPAKSDDRYFSAANPAQLGIGLFFMDYPQPSNFFEGLRCGAGTPGGYCNPTADRLFAQALKAQRADQVTADKLWARLDRMLTDDGARLSLYDWSSTTVLSDRVGNYLLNPKYGPLFGQMWVR